ncbi:cold shock-like protein CspC [Methylomusa anaerophila]|uniref:Cold shock-like protein CspC n=2 Tax=Methylomusa anaerophila TaxID=1930071 RepID=A0A348ALW8_9FIRM|nr:cold shock-like protein CspC [Methylomusa anaerophila]
MILQGKIKFYNEQRGFGKIITPKDEEVFFHFTAFPRGTQHQIVEGLEVEYEVGIGQNGRPAAIKVWLIGQYQGQKGQRTNKQYFSDQVVQKGHERGGALKGQEIENIEYYLPEDTRKYVNIQTIDNYALRLNKTPYFSDGKFLFFRVKRKDASGVEVLPKFDNIPFENLILRQRNTQKKMGLAVKELSVKGNWRLVIGLGSASVYETSITLHGIYGFPYLPGSSLKGTVRSYIIQECFGGEEKGSQTAALRDEGFRAIFGGIADGDFKAIQGGIIFFDALPKEAPKVKTDIMNPHFGPYYSSSGDKPPTDYYNPVPVPFLVVEKTRYQIAIGITKEKNQVVKDGVFNGRWPLDVAEEYTLKVLEECGIGAKTAVGYGIMEKTD